MARLVILIILSAVFTVSVQQNTTTSSPLELRLTDIDVEVKETESKRTNLHPSGPMLTCADKGGNPTRAYIASLTPSTPCGLKCVRLEPCSVQAGGGGNSSEYCLFFEPNQGTLRYSTTQRYTVHVCCANDIDKPVYDDFTMTVEPNTPPVYRDPALYDKVTFSGTATKPGAVITDKALADDIDGDTVYYSMSTNPDTPYLAIGYTDGLIRATNDLRFMCINANPITMSVSARDPFNPAIQTKKIDGIVNPMNKAPYATNADTTVTVDENVGADFTVFSLNVEDTDSKLYYQMYSTSDACMEQYKLVVSGKKAEVKTRINPDYEYGKTQKCTMLIRVNDGYCEANKTYSLNINMKNVNEVPKCYPATVKTIETYEGMVNVPTGMQVRDPDINDRITYSKTGGSAAEFDVDPITGNIFSPSVIDLDPGTPSKQYSVTVKAADNEGKSCTSAMTLTVLDANDLNPFFKSNSFNFAATECDEPGLVMGKVAGEDRDSSYNQNNKFYFGGGCGKMVVMSEGSCVLSQRCIDGEVFTCTATISDVGIYPGPLQGIPATISMTCGPCPPPTPAPTPAPAATTTTTTQKPTTTATTTTKKSTLVKSGDDSKLNDLLSWLIPAILGGLIWLALTAFLIYRYCCPCRNIFAGLCRRRRRRLKTPPTPPPPKKPRKPKTPKVTQVAPPKPPPPPKAPTPPPPQPPPPPPPKPEDDPYLFGFYKLTFTDQNEAAYIDAKTKPKPVEAMPLDSVVRRGNEIPPPNLRIGNPERGPPRVDAN